MYAILIGLALGVLVTLQIVFGQVWIRFFYVFGTTIHRDDNPVFYWFLVGGKAILAVGLVLTGGLSLLAR
jgi:hypothetical protein